MLADGFSRVLLCSSVAGMLVVLLAGCSAGESGVSADSSPTNVASQPSTSNQPSGSVIYSFDYPGYESVSEVSEASDAIVTGHVTGSEPFLLYPGEPTTTDPAVSPQYGASAEELAQIQPIVMTSFTFVVDESLQGDLKPGESIKVSQPGGVSNDTTYTAPDAAPLTVGKQKYLVALTGQDKSFGLVNPTEGAFKVTAGDDLKPILPGETALAASVEEFKQELNK